MADAGQVSALIDRFSRDRGLVEPPSWSGWSGVSRPSQRARRRGQRAQRGRRTGGCEYQTRLLARHIATYRADARVSGRLVWVLQDVAPVATFRGGSIRHSLPELRLVAGINQKGVFTHGGRPNPALAAVRDGSRRRQGGNPIYAIDGASRPRDPWGGGRARAGAVTNR